ncbi:hypothetical protein F5X68DRAFT_265761 [Plectosphaerella plurivora]|uniref:Zn(2)-C6 fungal-type domain-containing protein n=1 Tax=Plectosphaerella plurivora TaxID=936078 RepID=A0A9P8V2G9_9PEZI|nr:hypothetical protein F5X68DRAFT_265761 [Plectosphaerella plurivora]
MAPVPSPRPQDDLTTAPKSDIGLSATEPTPDDDGTTLDDAVCSDADNCSVLGEDALPEKVACDRCRRRKIKCDRIHPCTQCIRARFQCSYPVVQTRAKRQRVLILSAYESRIEHISNKIDDLTRLMESLNSTSREKTPSPLSNQRDSKYKLPAMSKPIKYSASENRTMENSLFTQAAAATSFLEEAVELSGEESAPETATALKAALETLQAVVKSQTRRSSPEEDSAPFACPLPFGTTTRDLPVPPMDKVMACMRMAQDHASTPLSWWNELKAYGDFTVYLVKVCSPGPATDAELIIAYVGLYCLFSECAAVAASESSKNDLHEQAQLCQSSLEAVLSNLGFHMPTTFDYVLAMYLTTLYCFQKGKAYASWGFISKASLLAQALGLHVPSTAPEASEDRNCKSRLWWSVYVLERSISLCLVRPSTIRDRDIMIPRPEPQLIASPTVSHGLPDLVNCGRLYGLIYDEIYSPRALAQPPTTRLARVQEIAAEWRVAIASNAKYWAALAKHFEGRPVAEMINFSSHAAAVGDHLVLTAIYRAVPGCTPQSISPECIEASRIALNGHTECLKLLLNTDPRSAMVKIWVNGALLLLPFIPFNIIFCNVVETGNLHDLDSLGDLVGAMTLLSEKPEYASCERQLQVFRSLHIVAASQNWATLGGRELDPFGTQLGSWFQESTDIMDYLQGS